jgi:hypothetical protein
MSLYRFLQSILPTQWSTPRSARRAARTALRARPWQPALEQLESRLVPTVSVFVQNRVLIAQADRFFNTVTVDHIGGSTVINGQSFFDGAFNSIQVNGGAGGLVSNIRATAMPLTVFGASNSDVDNLGDTFNRLQGIQAPVFLENEPHFSTVNINDQNDNGLNRTAVIDTINSPGESAAGRLTGVGAAPITWDYSDTSTVTLNFGPGTTTVNVLGTGVPTTVRSNGPATVNVGNGNLAGIQRDLSLVNVPSFDVVNINDFSDTTANRKVLITSTAVAGLSNGVIRLTSSSVSTLNVNGGRGDTTYTINGTPALSTLNLDTGPGSSGPDVVTDLVNVQANTAATNITTSGGVSQVGTEVQVGNAGTLSGIQGTLTVSSNPHSDLLVINDFADPINRTMTFNSTSASISGVPTIHFNASSLTGLTVIGGTGSNTFNITDASATDFIVVQAINGHNDTINVGDANNTLNGIRTPRLFLSGHVNFNTTLNINDQGSFTPHLYTVTSDTMTRSPGGPTIFYGGFQHFNLHPGRIGRGFAALDPVSANVINVEGTAAGTTVAVDPTGGDTVNVGNDQDGLDEFQGPLQVAGDNSVALPVNDQMTAQAQEYDLMPGELDRSGAAPITFSNLQAEAVNGGANGNTFDVDGVSAGTPATVNTGLGNNLVKMRQHNLIQDALNLHGQGKTDGVGYVAYQTDVFVDFQLGRATDIASFSGIGQITGGGGHNILVGDGHEDITGGTGPNLIISGGGAGQILGGGAGDILIGGSTAYDQNPAALQAILAYWTGSGDGYATRVANLLAGTGVPQLAAGVTVFDNGATNLLTGNGSEGTGALNLFFYTNAGGVPTDQQPSEVAINIDGAGGSGGGASSGAAPVSTSVASGSALAVRMQALTEAASPGASALGDAALMSLVANRPEAVSPDGVPTVI